MAAAAGAGVPLAELHQLQRAHWAAWEAAVSVQRIPSKQELAEIRREGERRLPAPAAADLLESHPGLAEWRELPCGWPCPAVAAAAAWLRGPGAQLRLARGDWLALLELSLSADADLSDLALGRIDFAPWPAFIKEMGAHRPLPTLATLCARVVAREAPVFAPIPRAAAAAVQRKAGGVWLDPSRLSDHDPCSPVPPAALRPAQPRSEWPLRLLPVAGATRVVRQRPAAGLGTGAAVWGAALALCEALAERPSGWLEGVAVVELGAGVGVGALCAALLGAASVVATDLPGEGERSLLPLIEENLRAASHSFPAGPGAACAAPLEWGNGAQAAEVLRLCGPGGCGVILASEVAYDASLFPLLLGAVLQLSGPRTEVITSHYPRTQGGCVEPELCEFERQARAAGFVMERWERLGSATGQRYVLHSMRLPAAPPPRPEQQ